MDPNDFDEKTRYLMQTMAELGHEKMFHLYLHDYFLRNNMPETAESFRREVDVSLRPIIDDSPRSCDNFSSQVREQTERAQQAQMNPLQPESSEDSTSSSNQQQQIDNQDPQRTLNVQTQDNPSAPRFSPRPHQFQILPNADARGKTAQPQPQPQGSMNVKGDDTPGRSSLPLRLIDGTEKKGSPLNEVASMRSCKKRVLCCHLSSDGKWLATGGNEKKVVIWSTKYSYDAKSLENHWKPITDIRFGPDSTILASSSFDKTVKIWDTVKPYAPLLILQGHEHGVTSLDFNPSKPDFLCSCDIERVIRYWNVTNGSCMRVFEGGINQVRFQPGSGQLLATAARKKVSIFDVETAVLLFSYEGHMEFIHSICWDPSGKYFVSVSQDRVKVWSAVAGEGCICELISNGNHFFSCAYHPVNQQILIIGGNRTLDLWNPMDGSKTLTVEAHENRVSSLSSSAATQMVASASYDSCVKLWR